MLKLDFDICQKSDCSGIKFTETTGLYNVSTNPTGWGTSFNTTNPDIATFQYSKLEFYDSGNNLITTLELYPDFPSSDITFTKELDLDIDDGIYKVVYTVRETKTTGISYTAEAQVAFYCKVNCCIMSMIKDIDPCCNCSHNALDKFNQAYALLQGLKCNCGNITQFNNILKVLQKICKNTNCKNC